MPLFECIYGVTTVFPEPLYPTIKVSGVWNWIVSLRVLSNERTLKIAMCVSNELEYIQSTYPRIESLSIFAMRLVSMLRRSGSSATYTYFMLEHRCIDRPKPYMMKVVPPASDSLARRQQGRGASSCFSRRVFLHPAARLPVK